MLATFTFSKLFPTSVLASSWSICAMRSARSSPSLPPLSPPSPPSLMSDNPSETSLSPLSLPFSRLCLPSETNGQKSIKRNRLCHVWVYCSPSIACTVSIKESGSNFTSGASPTCLQYMYMKKCTGSVTRGHADSCQLFNFCLTTGTQLPGVWRLCPQMTSSQTPQIPDRKTPRQSEEGQLTFQPPMPT